MLIHDLLMPALLLLSRPRAAAVHDDHASCAPPQPRHRALLSRMTQTNGQHEKCSSPCNSQRNERTHGAAAAYLAADGGALMIDRAAGSVSVHCQTPCHSEVQTEEQPAAPQAAVASIDEQQPQQLPAESNAARPGDRQAKGSHGQLPAQSNSAAAAADVAKPQPPPTTAASSYLWTGVVDPEPPAPPQQDATAATAAAPAPAAAPAAAQAAFQLTPPQASYRVTVWTRNARGAGTEGRPRLCVFGTNGGSTGEQLLDNGRSAFERGGVDVCRFVAADTGAIDHIVLALDDSSSGDPKSQRILVFQVWQFVGAKINDIHRGDSAAGWRPLCDSEDLSTVASTQSWA